MWTFARVEKDSFRRAGARTEWIAIAVDGDAAKGEKTREVLLLSRRGPRVAERDGKALIALHNAVEEVANKYMSGELERLPAVAAIEKIPGVKDAFEARNLLDSACTREVRS